MCAAYVWEARVKRDGVGFRECGSTVSRGQPPPLFFPPSKGRREKEGRICAANESTRTPLTRFPFPMQGRLVKSPSHQSFL